MTELEAKKLIFDLPEVYLAYSRVTNMPYVEEGAEDASDRVFLFSTKEEIQSFGLAKQEEKIPIMAMWHEKKTFPPMFVVLRNIGVDTIVFTKGEEEFILPLEFFIKEPDFSNLEEAKRPLYNPRLQLCSLYFLQMLRSPDREKKTALLRPLEEEVLENLSRSSFLCIVQPSEEEQGKIQVPLIRRKDGVIFMPLFSDFMELQKHTKGKPVKAVKVPFGGLRNILMDQANGVVINPLGFNLPLDRNVLQKLLGNA